MFVCSDFFFLKKNLAKEIKESDFGCCVWHDGGRFDFRAVHQLNSLHLIIVDNEALDNLFPPQTDPKKQIF